MTIEKARKILEKDGRIYSDEQVRDAIENARILSLACVPKIEKKLASDGTSYFTNKAYLEVK